MLESLIEPAFIQVQRAQAQKWPCLLFVDLDVATVSFARGLEIERRAGSHRRKGVS